MFVYVAIAATLILGLVLPLVIIVTDVFIKLQGTKAYTAAWIGFWTVAGVCVAINVVALSLYLY